MVFSTLSRWLNITATLSLILILRLFFSRVRLHILSTSFCMDLPIFDVLCKFDFFFQYVWPLLIGVFRTAG